VGCDLEKSTALSCMQLMLLSMLNGPHMQVAGLFGFPDAALLHFVLIPPGVKVGIFGVSSDADPDTLDRDQMLPSDEQPLRAFMERYLPQASGPLLRSSVCMFVMTPDGHFIIDQHPRHPQVRRMLHVALLGLSPSLN
jgi:hypothetical protein